MVFCRRHAYRCILVVFIDIYIRGASIDMAYFGQDALQGFARLLSFFCDKGLRIGVSVLFSSTFFSAAFFSLFGSQAASLPPAFLLRLFLLSLFILGNRCCGLFPVFFSSLGFTDAVFTSSFWLGLFLRFFARFCPAAAALSCS